MFHRTKLLPFSSDLELSIDQYEFVENLKENDSRGSFLRFADALRKKFPELEFYDDIQLQHMFSLTRLASWNIFQNYTDYFFIDDSDNNLIEFIKKPLQYLNNNPFPLFVNRTGMKWMQEEDDL